MVSDLLAQNEGSNAFLPEVVEIAVVATGLGSIRNNVGLFWKSRPFWDSTQWEVAPRPFLDTQMLAYANAIAAWARDDRSPAWAKDVLGELKRPIKNSIKYLFRTNDSFFQPLQRQSLLGQSQDQWWQLANTELASQQIIALRNLQIEHPLTESQLSILLETLGSANRAITLHGIATVERICVSQREFSEEAISDESIIQRLRLLADHRDDEVRAKAMCSLTRLARLNETSVEVASNMLESQVRHVIFAGGYALSSLDTIPDESLQLVDRCFVRALRACDYEFVGLFAVAYVQWLSDPQSHVQDLLQDSPEYLPVAMDALEHQPNQTISIQ